MASSSETRVSLLSRVKSMRRRMIDQLAHPLLDPDFIAATFIQASDIEDRTYPIHASDDIVIKTYKATINLLTQLEKVLSKFEKDTMAVIEKGGITRTIGLSIRTLMNKKDLYNVTHALQCLLYYSHELQQAVALTPDLAKSSPLMNSLSPAIQLCMDVGINRMLPILVNKADAISDLTEGFRDQLAVVEFGERKGERKSAQQEQIDWKEFILNIAKKATGKAIKHLREQKITPDENGLYDESKLPEKSPLRDVAIALNAITKIQMQIMAMEFTELNIPFFLGELQKLNQILQTLSIQGTRGLVQDELTEVKVDLTRGATSLVEESTRMLTSRESAVRSGRVLTRADLDKMQHVLLDRERFLLNQLERCQINFNERMRELKLLREIEQAMLENKLTAATPLDQLINFREMLRTVKLYEVHDYAKAIDKAIFQRTGMDALLKKIAAAEFALLSEFEKNKKIDERLEPFATEYRHLHACLETLKAKFATLAKGGKFTPCCYDVKKNKVLEGQEVRHGSATLFDVTSPVYRNAAKMMHGLVAGGKQQCRKLMDELKLAEGEVKKADQSELERDIRAALDVSEDVHRELKTFLLEPSVPLVELKEDLFGEADSVADESDRYDEKEAITARVRIVKRSSAYDVLDHEEDEDDSWLSQRIEEQKQAVEKPKSSFFQKMMKPKVAFSAEETRQILERLTTGPIAALAAIARKYLLQFVETSSAVVSEDYIASFKTSRDDQTGLYRINATDDDLMGAIKSILNVLRHLEEVERSIYRNYCKHQRLGFMNIISFIRHDLASVNQKISDLVEAIAVLDAYSGVFSKASQFSQANQLQAAMNPLIEVARVLQQNPLSVFFGGSQIQGQLNTMLEQLKTMLPAPLVTVVSLDRSAVLQQISQRLDGWLEKKREESKDARVIALHAAVTEFKATLAAMQKVSGQGLQYVEKMALLIEGAQKIHLQLALLSKADYSDLAEIFTQFTENFTPANMLGRMSEMLPRADIAGMIDLISRHFMDPDALLQSLGSVQDFRVMKSARTQVEQVLKSNHQRLMDALDQAFALESRFHLKAEYQASQKLLTLCRRYEAVAATLDVKLVRKYEQPVRVIDYTSQLFDARRVLNEQQNILKQIKPALVDRIISPLLTKIEQALGVSREQQEESKRPVSKADLVSSARELYTLHGLFNRLLGEKPEYKDALNPRFSDAQLADAVLAVARSLGARGRMKRLVSGAADLLDQLAYDFAKGVKKHLGKFTHKLPEIKSEPMSTRRLSGQLGFSPSASLPVMEVILPESLRIGRPDAKSSGAPIASAVDDVLTPSAPQQQVRVQHSPSAPSQGMSSSAPTSRKGGKQ